MGNHQGRRWAPAAVNAGTICPAPRSPPVRGAGAGRHAEMGRAVQPMALWHQCHRCAVRRSATCAGEHDGAGTGSIAATHYLTSWANKRHHFLKQLILARHNKNMPRPCSQLARRDRATDRRIVRPPGFHSRDSSPPRRPTTVAFASWLPNPWLTGSLSMRGPPRSDHVNEKTLFFSAHVIST